MCDEHKTDYLCECSGYGCDERIHLIFAEAKAIFLGPDWHELWIISDDCPNGPESHYTLVEKREGYTLYREEVDHEPS